MDRRTRGAGDIRSRLRSRGESPWFYDRLAEDFRHARWPVRDAGPEITFRVTEAPPRRRTRLGRLGHCLFVQGWMTVVFLGGIMAFAIIAALLGYR